MFVFLAFGWAVICSLCVCIVQLSVRLCRCVRIPWSKLVCSCSVIVCLPFAFNDEFAVWMVVLFCWDLCVVGLLLHNFVWFVHSVIYVWFVRLTYTIWFSRVLWRGLPQKNTCLLVLCNCLSAVRPQRWFRHCAHLFPPKTDVSFLPFPSLSFCVCSCNSVWFARSQSACLFVLSRRGVYLCFLLCCGGFRQFLIVSEDSTLYSVACGVVIDRAPFAFSDSIAILRSCFAVGVDCVLACVLDLCAVTCSLCSCLVHSQSDWFLLLLNVLKYLLC